MKKTQTSKVALNQAREVLLGAQGFLSEKPFGLGTEGAYRAICHLGYVQIDTIHVIERAHHHILWSRVPDYRVSHLASLQTEQKKIFEHWTHALAIIPIDDFRYSLPMMEHYQKNREGWFEEVSPRQIREIHERVKKTGPLSIRQIEEAKVEKSHPWASKKPSKKVLEYLFYAGRVAIHSRNGIEKKYVDTLSHFGWKAFPAAPTIAEILEHRLERALRSQGLITLKSCTHLEGESRPAMKKLLEKKLKTGELETIEIEAVEGTFYKKPVLLKDSKKTSVTRLLSPFDPLIIQRDRLKAFFGMDYVLECYVPAVKRKHGYFCLPVLDQNQMVARIDLKTNRQLGKLQIQSWHWEKTVPSKKDAKKRIEAELHRFAQFQFNRSV